MLAALRMQVLRCSQIAVVLGCHRSTVGRELKRNCSVSDGRYRADKDRERSNGRRARRNQQFAPADFARLDALLEQRWSPEQIAASLSISHQPIYRHVWRDKRSGSHFLPSSHPSAIAALTRRQVDGAPPTLSWTCALGVEIVDNHWECETWPSSRRGSASISRSRRERLLSTLRAISGENHPALATEVVLALRGPENLDGEKIGDKAMRDRQLPHVAPRRLNAFPRL
jgi:IS30 family transposase